MEVQINSNDSLMQGGGRRSLLVPEGEPLSYYFEDAKTLYEGFRRGRFASGEWGISPGNIDTSKSNDH